jgi:quinoprotein glucose dehydrogenase
VAFTSPYVFLLQSIGLSAIGPPWSQLTAYDLNTGEIKWQVPDGGVTPPPGSTLNIPADSGAHMPRGGPLVTAGGVAFYSGTLDYYLRAYDVTTGRKLWQARLPAGGQSTPMTYRAGGRQLVVVAAGGHGSFGTTAGDAVLAFALE